jgi:hypothetical protein
MLKLSVVLLLAAYLFACTVQGENMKQTEPPPKPQEARLYPIIVDGKHGFMDETGSVKFMLPEEVYTTFAFSDGLAVAGKRVPNTNGRWGFIDETGKYVIEAKFVMVKPFSEGLAAVVFKENESAYATVGYIDQSGRVVIPPQFSGEGSAMGDFSEGLAAIHVYKDRKDQWGYIDKSGKVVIQPQFTAAGPFSQGRAIVGIAEPAWSIDYKWGVIDTEGRWIAKPQYQSAHEFSEGLAPVLLNNKVGFIDLQGEMLIEPQFDPDGAGDCVQLGRVAASRFSEGLAAVRLKRQVWAQDWGFIDRHGNWVIQPAFACAAPFREGLALIGVREDQGAWRYGYIDKTGAIVIKPQFSEASSFVGKLALVTIGMTEEEAFVKALDSGKPEAEVEKELKKFKKKYAYIDRTGKVVWQTPD